MLPSSLLGRSTHRELTELLKAERRLVLSGASNETAKALLLGALLEQRPGRALLVTEKEEGGEALRHWLEFFQQETHTLLSIENGEEEIVPEALQLFLLFMRGEGNEIFLCPRYLWETPFPLFSELLSRTLTVGKKIDFTAFVEDLIERGYQHGADLFLAPGEYRRIGDGFDIYPVQSSHPYRVSFDMDTVEKILEVDTADLSKTSPGGKSLEIFPILYEATAPLERQLPKDLLLVLDDQDDISFPLKNPALRFTPFPESDAFHAHVRYLSVLKFYTLTDFLNDVRDKLLQQWSIFVVTKRLDELKTICEEEHITFTTNADGRKPGTLVLVRAGCPICGDSLMCIVDTSRALEVIREYHHEKGSPKARRRRFCKRKFSGFHEVETAKRERWAMESIPIGSSLY